MLQRLLVCHLKSNPCGRRCSHVMQDHIVVLAASLSSNIDFLLSPLRASYMDGTGYSRHVVILTEGGVRDLLRSPRSGGLTLSSSTPLGISNSDQRVQVSPIIIPRHHLLPGSSVALVAVDGPERLGRGCGVVALQRVRGGGQPAQGLGPKAGGAGEGQCLRGAGGHGERAGHRRGGGHKMV